MLGSFGCQHGLRLTKDPKIVRYYNALLDIMVPKESYGSASSCSVPASGGSDLR